MAIKSFNVCNFISFIHTKNDVIRNMKFQKLLSKTRLKLPKYNNAAPKLIKLRW